MSRHEKITFCGPIKKKTGIVCLTSFLAQLYNSTLLEIEKRTSGQNVLTDCLSAQGWRSLWDPDADLWSFSAHVTPLQIDSHQILMNGDLNQSPLSWAADRHGDTALCCMSPSNYSVNRNSQGPRCFLIHWFSDRFTIGLKDNSGAKWTQGLITYVYRVEHSLGSVFWLIECVSSMK